MSSSHNTTKSYDFQIIIHKVKYVSNEAQPNQFSLHIQFDNDEIENVKNKILIFKQF